MSRCVLTGWPCWPGRSPSRCASTSSTCCAGTASRSVSASSCRFDVPQSTFSHHIKKLVDAGLVTVERRHKWAYYSISSDALKELTAWLS
jgi:ArsR family transcriptional regulator